MKKLFIKELQISNYKCFEKENIKFNTPDLINKWSWLNILIWENWNWKTTILEAINYMTLNSYSAENKLNISDFKDYSKEIIINGITEEEFKCKMESFYTWSYFENKWFQFIAENRKLKERWKLLSSPFNIKNNFINITDNYIKSDWTDSGKPIPWNYWWFDNRIIDDWEINIFLFDKNRNRHSNTWSYKTTFDKITDDLNWKFINNISDENKKELINNICWEYFKNVLDISQKWTWKKLWKEMSNFFENKDFENLKIDLLNLLHPFSSSFFTIREDSDLKQINIRDLWSWVEIILSLLLVRSIAWESKGSIIYLIDEPELHLHPKAQEQLLELLLEESKNKQIFISTHSPYMFKNCLSYKWVWLYILNKNDKWKIEIHNSRSNWWGLFPWSPSWWEINYYSYSLPTVEFHNELYGFIQERTWSYNEDLMEKYFVNQSCKKNKVWKKLKNWTVEPWYNISLPWYIRNRIHHPENTNNIQETIDELKESISLMISIIKTNKL